MDRNNHRILLVDDEPDITLSFSIGLEDSGFVVDAFNDPLRAVSSLKQGLYALALIDIRMPKMNGFELYKELRKKDDKVIVIFMTAFDVQKEDLETAGIPAASEKTVNIVRKPIQISDLVRSVRAKLEEKG
jgi:two-component system, OmpR family, response regulator ChvI